MDKASDFGSEDCSPAQLHFLGEREVISGSLSCNLEPKPEPGPIFPQQLGSEPSQPLDLSISVQNLGFL
ncbi:unnamed protein product [Toxocara canis]|uniref:Zinc finger protein 410 n=1 Tax=Toxocara canis TaxID=6265 RepID=A0A183UYD0_TOXCA|nr:unnamed protein product [Toxocara canis]